jgi:lipid A 3-O-deacylase
MEGAKHFRRVRGGARAGLLPALAAAGFLLPASTAGAANALGIDELKFGVLAHSVGGHEEDSVDLNGEVLFLSPVPPAALAGVPLRPLLLPLLTPRPDIGFEANTAGETSQVYFGLTWTWLLARDLFRTGDGIDVGIGFGPAFNNGKIRSPTVDRNSLGSNVLFHTSGELGYRLSPRYEVSLFFDHVSNAGLARENEGQNDAGVRFGISY